MNISITEVKLEKKKECYIHTEQEIRQKTECKIAEIDAEIEIFTDGSTAGNQQSGGTGVFAQDKNGKNVKTSRLDVLVIRWGDCGVH